MALPYHIYVISTQIPGMPITIQYGTVLVLLVFVLAMNLIAISDPVAGTRQEAMVMDKQDQDQHSRPASTLCGRQISRCVESTMDIIENKINVIFRASQRGKIFPDPRSQTG